MPNWCQNFATVTCPSKEIYDKLLDAIKQNIWFETFAPLGLDPEIYEDGWEYSKAIETWKTKWGAKDVQVLTQDDYEDVANCHDAVDEEIYNNIEDRKQKLTLELHFETAWSPPNGVYSIMNKNYGIETVALYDEEGCDFFGRCIYSKEQELDETYEFPTNKEELEELRKVIGSELDDYLSSTWERLEEEWNEEDEEEDHDSLPELIEIISDNEECEKPEINEIKCWEW